MPTVSGDTEYAVIGVAERRIAQDTFGPVAVSVSWIWL